MARPAQGSGVERGSLAFSEGVFAFAVAWPDAEDVVEVAGG